MKFRKILSLAVVVAVVMTNAVIISAPTAYAAAEKEGTKYEMSFGSNKVGYSTTLTRLDDYGWYAADNTKLYTPVDGTKDPYKALEGKFAQILADPTGSSGNYALKVCSAGERYGTYKGVYLKNYGYGTTFPGVEANSNVSGSWEIEFYFIPNFNESTDEVENAEFAFTINTDVGPNNLLCSDGTDMIIGQFNPTATATPFSSSAVTMNAIPLQKAIYKLKTFLNIDQGYYSVELWVGSTCVARRSPITLNSSNVRFLKFSALGINSVSYVYVDNLLIKSAADASSSLHTDGREKLIYSDDFNSYSGSTPATEAMSTQLKGSSFFPGKYTPWRAYASLDNANYSVTDGVLRLGKQSGTERSIMIYAMRNETILDTTSERTRGMLNISFKFNPEGIKANSGFSLNLGAAHNSPSQSQAFALGISGTSPKIMFADGSSKLLDATHWYAVNMTIDVINRAINYVITDTTANTLCVAYVQAPTSGGLMTPTSIGQIMFKCGDGAGSYIFLDDVSFSYLPAAPTVDTGKIVMKDKFNNTVSGTADVTAAINTIEVPLGTIANGTTVSDFTLVDDSSNSVVCTGTLNTGDNYTFGDTFTLTPSTLLKSGKTYTLTVSTDVASVYGSNLASPAIFTFTTTDSLSDLISISAVKVNGTAVTALSDITAGSTINVETKYVNNKAEAIPAAAIVAFYGQNKAIKALIGETTVSANTYGTDTETFEFSVPSNIDMDSVRKVSVFLWDGFENILPYCNDVSFE